MATNQQYLNQVKANKNNAINKIDSLRKKGYSDFILCTPDRSRVVEMCGDEISISALAMPTDFPIGNALTIKRLLAEHKQIQVVAIPAIEWWSNFIDDCDKTIKMLSEKQ